MRYSGPALLSPRFLFRPVLGLMLLCFMLAAPVAQAGDRSRIKAFLEVTGFDVALDSIALSASAAPAMLGMPEGQFGSDWTRLTEEVFASDIMRGLAVDILVETLDDETLNHGAAFYASELGQRLIVVENESHMMEDDAAKKAEGEALIAQMVEDGAPRLDLLQRMTRAIAAADTSVRAVQEIQLRFLLAASAAGVIELRMDATELRAFMKSQEPQMRMSILQGAITNAAYTYRSISDADVKAYVIALEDPTMGKVYELLNAVQYEVMANRFEELALRMADLHPAQDI